MRRFPSIPAMAGLLVLATATTATAAVAQVRGACGQIRVACIEAGFIQGAVAEGVGLQVHCVTPIMQGRPQPPSARRRLPKVSAQLVADCQASRMSRFGRALLPEEDVILPPREVAVPPPPAANPHPTPGGRTAVAAAGQDIL